MGVGDRVKVHGYECFGKREGDKVKDDETSLTAGRL